MKKNHREKIKFEKKEWIQESREEVKICDPNISSIPR